MPKKSAAATLPGPLDLASLAHEDAALPAAKRVVENRKWDNNPLVDPLRSTMGSENGKAVTVPAFHVREIAGGLRDAAEKITAEGTPTGVRLIFRYTDDNGEAVQTSALMSVPEDDRQVTVLYTAKARRRTLDDAQKDEARREGFVNDKNVVNGRAYLEWVEAGRPRMGDDENHENHEG